MSEVSEMSEVTTDPIAVEGAAYASYFVEAAEGVQLKVMQWLPTKPVSDDPLIFLAGWVSAIYGWAELIRSIAVHRPVYYIESREKGSALIVDKKWKPEDFGVIQMGEDLVHGCPNLDIDLSRTVIAGSSLGAAAILEAMKQGRLPVRGAFLIGPNVEFSPPFIFRMLFCMPAASFYIIRYFVLWFLRNFRVDMKKEPEQYARYKNTIMQANAQRIKLSAMGMTDHDSWTGLESIKVPVAVAYAKSDKLHDHETITRLEEVLQQPGIIACPSNLYMHDQRVHQDIEAFIDGMES